MYSNLIPNRISVKNIIHRMSRRKFDDSSDESDKQCYRRKRSRPICYTSDDNISEQGFIIDNSCVRLSNLHLSPNTMLQETEWQTIPTTQVEKEVAEPDRGQDAKFLIENINCSDPFEIYELFVTDSIILLMIQQTNKYTIQIGTDNKTKKHQSSWIPVFNRRNEDLFRYTINYRCCPNTGH